MKRNQPPADGLDRPGSLSELDRRVADCAACPRLVAWRETVARVKRASFEHEEYWGRAVPGFGDPRGRILAVGLAPAAHGANRTGRMFTGDRSGDWLFAALHRAGLATQPEATARHDGLELQDMRVTSAVHCAPPDNRPTIDERDRCAPWLREEIRALLPTLEVVVALGRFGWLQAIRMLDELGYEIPTPRPNFGHGEEFEVRPGSHPPARRDDGAEPGAEESRDRPRPPLTILASYHPSQQNTFTGTLTEEMFDSVWRRALEIVG